MRPLGARRRRRPTRAARQRARRRWARTRPYRWDIIVRIWLCDECGSSHPSRNCPEVAR